VVVPKSKILPASVSCPFLFVSFDLLQVIVKQLIGNSSACPFWALAVAQRKTQLNRARNMFRRELLSISRSMPVSAGVSLFSINSGVALQRY